MCPPDTDTPGLQTENQTKPLETIALSKNAKLMKPNDVAKALLKGLKQNKFLIIPGFDGKLIYFISRLFPWLIELVSDLTIKKTQSKKNT